MNTIIVDINLITERIIDYLVYYLTKEIKTIINISKYNY